MSMRYVSLRDLFPTKSRATLYRWRKAGKIPKPDLVINGREYYRERPLGQPGEDEGDAHDQKVRTA